MNTHPQPCQPPPPHPLMPEISGRPNGAYKVIAAGHFHNCAIALDDTIKFWGQEPPP